MKACLLAAALAVFFAFASQAVAQANCADRADANSILSDMYGESPMVAGYSSSGHIMEIWRNEETGTWTALIILPSGVACVVDQGEAFQPVNRPQGEPM